MGGRLLHLEGVGQAPVVVAGIRHPADDGDGHLLDAEGPVQAVHGADEARGVAGGQLQVVLPQALLVVGVAVEEHIRHVVFLAALEDGLDAQPRVDGLVPGPNTGRGGVQHDVHAAAQLLKGPRHGDVLGGEGGGVGALHQIELVFHAVGADHVVFPQGLQGQRGRQVRDAHQLHVLLKRHAVRQPLSNGAVAGHTYPNFFHSPPPEHVQNDGAPGAGQASEHPASKFAKIDFIREFWNVNKR